MKPTYLICCSLLAVLFFGGCAHQALPRKASQPLVKTERQTNDARTWWQPFNDPQLDQLLQRVTSENPRYEIAMQRIVTARLQTEQLATRTVPYVGYEATAERNRFSGAGTGFNSGSTQNDFELLPLSLSYELDLWGRLRNGIAAGEADAEALAADAQTLILLLQSDLATHYYGWQTVHAEAAVLEQAEQIREQALKLTRLRFEAGDISEIDVALAQTELAGVRAERVALHRDRVAREAAIAGLLGAAPSELKLTVQALTETLTEWQLEAPEDLFAGRPDVQSARRRLDAARARQSIIRSGTLPDVSLSGSAGFSADEAGDIGASNSETWGGALTLSGPIYQGGNQGLARKVAASEIAQAEAAVRAAELEAIQEAESAVQLVELLEQERIAWASAVGAAQQSATLIEKQYRAGLVDFFEVVTAQRTLLRNEQVYARTLGQSVQARIALIKALGGH